MKAKSEKTLCLEVPLVLKNIYNYIFLGPIWKMQVNVFNF